MGSQPSFIKKGGEKPIEMDFDSFQKRSISKVSTEQQLEQARQKMQSMSEELKKFKYHEDFDRTQRHSTNMLIPSLGFQKMIGWSLIFGIASARFYVLTYYRHYYSTYLMRRFIIPFTLINILTGTLAFLGVQQSHIINSTDYQQLPPQIRAYRGFDQQLNLYKYVDDIKYNYDYSNSDIFNTDKKFLKRKSAELEKNIKDAYMQKQRDYQRFYL